MAHEVDLLICLDIYLGLSVNFLTPRRVKDVLWVKYAYALEHVLCHYTYAPVSRKSPREASKYTESNFIKQASRKWKF